MTKKSGTNHTSTDKLYSNDHLLSYCVGVKHGTVLPVPFMFAYNKYSLPAREYLRQFGMDLRDEHNCVWNLFSSVVVAVHHLNISDIKWLGQESYLRGLTIPTKRRDKCYCNYSHTTCPVIAPKWHAKLSIFNKKASCWTTWGHGGEYKKEKGNVLFDCTMSNSVSYKQKDR